MENHTNPLNSGVCRLCLKKPVVVDIFNKPDLAQDILLCTGVDVTKSSKLPRKICLKCFEIVTNAKELRNLAMQNDLEMKVLFDYDDNLSNGNNKTDEDDSGSSSDEDRLYIDDKDDSNRLEDDNITKYSMSSPTTQGQISETLKVCENVTKRIVVKRDLFKFSEPCENVTKGIVVRRDLFKFSEPVSPVKECTYAEGTNYAKSKNFNKNKSDVDVTYNCELCPKKFTSWKKVYLHQRSHNKHLPCPLKTCGKKFATKGDVEKHIRTHTGERPYKCDICEKGFSQQCTLRIHKETVHAKETLVVY